MRIARHNTTQSMLPLSEKLLSFAFCFILFVPFVNYYVSFCLKELGYDTVSIIFYPLIYIFSVIAYLLVFRKTLKPLYFLIAFLFMLIFSVLFFPDNINYIFTGLFDLPYNPIYRTVFLGFPLLFTPFVIKDFKYLSNCFRIFSRITLLIAVFSFVYLIVLAGIKFEYMTFAYYLLLPAIYCFIDSINRKKIIFFIISLFSLFCAALLGSRGALLSVVVFFLMYCFFFYRNGPRKNVLIVLLILVIIFTSLFYEKILEALLDLSKTWNFESRSLENLLDSTLFESKGRDIITKDLIRALGKNLFGYGIFGDRVITGSGYAHNIFLELLIHYGFIFGTILIIGYIYITLSPMFFDKYKKNSDIFTLYFALFSSAFVKLIFSDSYLLFPTFWALIAFSILIIRSVNYEKNI